MSITLNLTDGTTTLVLSGSGAYGGVTYAPQPPAVSVLEAEDATVSETATLTVEGTESAISTAMQAVEALLALARRRQQTQSGPRVYLQYKMHASDTLHRSEVMDGTLAFDPDPGRRQVRWGTVLAGLTIERRAYWETDAAVSLGSGSITNDGASRLSLGTPAGTIPAPVKLTITNTSGTISPRHFYAAVNAFADPGSVDLTLPGGTINWSTAQDHSTYYLEYDFDAVDSGHMADLAGERYFVLVGLDAATGESYLKTTISTKIGGVPVPAAWSSEVYVGTVERIIVFGPLPLPPTGGTDGANNVVLALSLRDVSATHSGQLVASWIQLMPASSFRHFRQTGFTHGNGDKWVDDGPGGEVYVETSAGDKWQIMQAWGAPLTVFPDRTNELRLVFDETTAGVTSARTVTAAVEYRPRRLLI